MKKLSSKKGFTLIEMLVVIAIIAIMAAIIVPTVTSSTKKAKYATDAANLRSAIAECEVYALKNDISTTHTFTTSEGAYTTFTVKGDYGNDKTIEIKMSDKGVITGKIGGKTPAEIGALAGNSGN